MKWRDLIRVVLAHIVVVGIFGVGAFVILRGMPLFGQVVGLLLTIYFARKWVYEAVALRKFIDTPDRSLFRTTVEMVAEGKIRTVVHGEIQ